ncbi:uncharacterized protein LOC120106661 [Phoenix dactylifera]|uniref:Uncharacterized protein LOC120106661 n=1 Tax=Phoenix dactylifera TaxID=42345 RepID=A0A8B8ZW63_PHODC|nr:uncharacterized protein LOC120106661 [Phoenix dactylifera]
MRLGMKVSHKLLALQAVDAVYCVYPVIEIKSPNICVGPFPSSFLLSNDEPYILIISTSSLLVLASIFFFYSFVASLEKFLTSRRPVSAGSSSVAADAGGAAVKALDDKIWGKETGRLYGDPADPWSGLSVVRVYVYEMPAKFTYDLLWLFRNTYKETTNLMSNGSPVHRLIEQLLVCTACEAAIRAEKNEYFSPYKMK